jgi:hypothetical protein
MLGYLFFVWINRMVMRRWIINILELLNFLGQK